MIFFLENSFYDFRYKKIEHKTLVRCLLEKLLTTDNPDTDHDQQLFSRLGINTVVGEHSAPAKEACSH